MMKIKILKILKDFNHNGKQSTYSKYVSGAILKRPEKSKNNKDNVKKIS